MEADLFRPESLKQFGYCEGYTRELECGRVPADRLPGFMACLGDSVEYRSMTCPLIWRPSLLAVCIPLLGSLAGCWKQHDRTASTDESPLNQARDEGGLNADGKSHMEKRPTRGFKEYVKNPELFRQHTQEKGIGDSAPPATPQELAALVATMSRRRLDYEELQKLKKAGDKVAPLLQTALQDDKFLFHRYGKSVLDGSPIETALDLLEPFALPALRILEPALRNPDEFFRYHALCHLARCGNDDAIDALSAGLSGQSERCRTWTLMGLEFLKGSPRGSKKFRAALFEAALPVLADEAYGPAEHAPRALLALDGGRAGTVLLGAGIFHPDNKSIYRVLQALKGASVPVPGRQLRVLLAGIKKKATGIPFDYAYAEGLILLAQVEGLGARDLIDDAASWGNERVKKGAAEGSAIAAGVADPYGFVSDIYERKGVKGLTDPQLYYLALSWLDAEVCNGGFGQYYFNSSGELAPHAVQAARAVGASEIAGIIQKANVLFGKNGPAADRAKRMDQLSKINLESLGKLDTQYFKCPERLSEILAKFVASNADAFKPAK